MTRRDLMELEIDRIKKILIEQYFVKKIIVFGSYARNMVNETSDLDIMVIKDTNDKFTKRLKKIMLLTKPLVATDFFVYSEEEVSQMIKEKNMFFIDEILDKGQVIFGGGLPFKYEI